MEDELQALESRLLEKLSAHLDARLQRAVVAVTSNLEGAIQRQVRESHDGLAARIEDVTAAKVEQALSSRALGKSSASTGATTNQGSAESTSSSVVSELRAELQALRAALEEVVSPKASVTQMMRESGVASAENVEKLQGYVDTEITELHRQLGVLATAFSALPLAGTGGVGEKAGSPSSGRGSFLGGMSAGAPTPAPGQAVNSLATWFSDQSQSPSQAAVPTREMIRAAARELASMAQDQKEGSHPDLGSGLAGSPRSPP